MTSLIAQAVIDEWSNGINLVNILETMLPQVEWYNTAADLPNNQTRSGTIIKSVCDAADLLSSSLTLWSFTTHFLHKTVSRGLLAHVARFSGDR